MDANSFTSIDNSFHINLMSDQNNTSDKDLKLAKKIGDWLKEDVPFSTLDEPELDVLFKYKKTYGKPAPPDSKREAVWGKIQSDIKQPTPAIPSGNYPTIRILAIAASLLIIALSALFILRETDDLDIIAQSDTGIETVMLEDRSEVILRPNSTLYRQTGSDLYTLEGEGYFVITENPDRVFSVQAGEGRVEVLGTRFNLREWGDQTEVFLEEGKIQLSLIDRSNKVILLPGQKSGISQNLKITEPVEASADEITGWKNQELVFHNRKTEEIFNELEYHFNIQITAPQHILDESLGGAVSLAELEHCLRDLETVLNGEFVATGSKQYQFVSND